MAVNGRNAPVITIFRQGNGRNPRAYLFIKAAVQHKITAPAQIFGNRTFINGRPAKVIDMLLRFAQNAPFHLPHRKPHFGGKFKRSERGLEQ